MQNPPRSKPPVADPSGGVSGAAKNFTDQARNAGKTNSDLVRDREKGIIAIGKSIEASSIPTDREIAFAKNWKELSDRRKEMVSAKLTEGEAKLLKALNSTMTPNYDRDEFKSVLNHLMDKSGITIIVDETSLDDAKVDYKDPVTFKLPAKVTVRTVLKKVLGDRGLTYIIKEGNVQVMTPKKAAEYTVVRTYQIDDLVAPISTNPQMMMMFGPQVQQFQMLQNAQMIINMIQSTIEPAYWQPNGPGSITYFPATKSLIVRASSEIHYQMSSPGLFGAGR